MGYLKPIRLVVEVFLAVILCLNSCSRPPTGKAVAETKQTDYNEDNANTLNTLQSARDYAGEIDSAAVLVLYRGETFFSFGDTATKYMCHSIRKPLLGALYGIYVERGVIDLSAHIGDLGIDDIEPVLTNEEKRATVRDLLMSRSGVYHEAAGEAQSMKDARPERGSHPPGTWFYYNNWDFNALGTIFIQLTGRDIFQVFEEEIAKPIGMEDFSARDGTYVYERENSEHPAYFFRMSTRDLARFGLLYMNYGMWQGLEPDQGQEQRQARQIVPEEWIRESTTVYPVENPWGDPYGYLWRIIPDEAGLGYGFYHAGLGVHLLVVLPDRELVLVHRVNTDRDFDITWTEIKTLLEMIVSAL